MVGNQRGRSAFIERAIRHFLLEQKRILRDRRDPDIINSRAEELNREAEDVLSYQVEL